MSAISCLLGSRNAQDKLRALYPAREGNGGESAAAHAGSGPSFRLPAIDAAFDAWLRAQLEASPDDDKNTDDFKYITFSELPPFTDAHKSLMRKTMTPELFATLKGVKSSKGYSLSNGMQAGVLRPHLGVGFTCGDEECFELFKDVIDPIVKGWHGFDPATQTHTSDLDFSKLVFTEEDAALFAKYVKSTRVRAARNISGFSLPAGSSKEDRLAVEGVLKEAFGNLPDELKGTYYPLGELSSEQEDALQAGGFLFQKPGPMQLLGAAGAGRDWPSGRGIFHNPDKTVLCWCNEEDQCRIIAMENGGDIKGVFTRFCQLSNAIKDASEKAGKKLMEHPNYGFLGTCPSNLGTGLRASVMIVLPELNKDVHKLEEICAGFDLQPRGSSGEHSAAVGAKWDVSNKQRIGWTEVELVQKMIDGVKKLIALEEELAASASSGSSASAYTLEFGVYGAFASRDLAATSAALLTDADIQVKEEPRATAFAMLGTPTAGGFYPPAPEEETRDRVFWLASFENQDAYDTDHKARESNKALLQALAATGLNQDNFMLNMAGSYMGPLHHLEKAGAARSTRTYSCVASVRARDSESAARLFEVVKGHGQAQLAAEEDSVRFTVFRVADGVMPGPKDDLTIKWIEVWRTADAHEAHKKTAHYEQLVATIKAMADGEAAYTVMEFGETTHFARPS